MKILLRSANPGQGQPAAFRKCRIYHVDEEKAVEGSGTGILIVLLPLRSSSRAYFLFVFTKNLTSWGDFPNLWSPVEERRLKWQLENPKETFRRRTVRIRMTRKRKWLWEAVRTPHLEVQLWRSLLHPQRNPFKFHYSYPSPVFSYKQSERFY
jgi:hypothetical protein